MAKIKVSRTKEFRDYLRAYEITLNDSLLGTVKAGETELFDINPGIYRIKLKIDWCSSEEITFEVSNDEIINFTCGNNANFITALYFLFFNPNNYLWLKRI